MLIGSAIYGPYPEDQAFAVDPSGQLSAKSVIITQRDTVTTALTLKRAGVSYTNNLLSARTESDTEMSSIGSDGKFHSNEGFAANGGAFTLSAFLGTPDLRLLRESAKKLELDDNAGGAADLHITGNLLADTIVRPGSGATGSRPTVAAGNVGSMWFDTTLGKPIWWTGSGWVDATGTAV